MLWIILFFCFLLVIWLIPDSIWRRVFSLWQGHQSLSAKEQQKYWLAFTKLSDPLADHRKEFLQNLKPYKFYLPLMHEILQQGLLKGLSLKSVFSDIRSYMQKDLEFNTHLKVEERGSFLQFFSLIGFVWIFVLIAHYMVQLSVPTYVKWVIFILQLSGLCSFYLLMKLVVGRSFLPYDLWMKEVVCFHSMVEVGVGLDQCFPAKLEGSSKGPVFTMLWQKLKMTYSAALEKGKSMQADLIEIKEQLGFARELNFKLWQKRLVGLKLLWLFTFFFSSYLLCIGSLFTSILTKQSATGF